MNYNKIYESLIKRAKSRQLDPLEYYEKHHIVPRCIGGTDDPENIVSLLASEHRFAHLCLVRIYPGRPGLVNAAAMMNKCKSVTQVRSKSKEYQWLRKRHRDSMSFFQSGEKNSQFGKVWIYSLSEQKSQRVLKSQVNDYLSNGWELGRVINFNKLYRACKVCNTPFIKSNKSNLSRKTCSDACNAALRKKGIKLQGREQEFLDLYAKNKSMNKSLKMLGVQGAVSVYYTWAKDLVDKHFN